MKHFRKLVALLLALMTLLSVIPTAGLAAIKVKTLKMNTWYSSQSPGDPYSTTWKAYKLKVTADTVVYISWKNAHTKSTFAEVDFFRDRDCSDLVYIKEFYEPASGKDAVVLYPGTYYISIFDVIKGSKIKFSTKKASALKATNTSSKKASSLKAGKKAEMMFDKKNSRARWYKLKLTKKQAIKLYVNQAFFGNLTLYNSKLKKVPIRQKGNWDYITKNKLSKGTYYLKVNGYSDLEYGIYGTISWK